MKAKRLSCLLLPVLTVVLELLPYGAVCNFANPEGEPFRRTYAYFDLTPFGYANFSPLLTALLTCVMLALLVVFLFTGKAKLARVATLMTLTAAALSLCPLLLGIRYYSVVGGLITVTLLAETALLSVSMKNGKGPGSVA